MVRWRYCLVMAMLLLLPSRIGSKIDEDDDEERRGEEGEDEDDDDEEDEEEEAGGPDKGGGGGGDQHNHMAQIVGRRAPPSVMPTQKIFTITRTPKKRPLECYVCAYKSETPLRACLDPTKFSLPEKERSKMVAFLRQKETTKMVAQVHTMTCHSAEDQCFTSVMSKGQSFETVVRGCRSGCSSSADTTCCDMNRCNNQAFAMPLLQPQILASNKQSCSSKFFPPNVLFFVTILLLLQTVVKVAFV